MVSPWAVVSSLSFCAAHKRSKGRRWEKSKWVQVKHLYTSRAVPALAVKKMTSLSGQTWRGTRRCQVQVEQGHLPHSTTTESFVGQQACSLHRSLHRSSCANGWVVRPPSVAHYSPRPCSVGRLKVEQIADFIGKVPHFQSAIHGLTGDRVNEQSYGPIWGLVLSCHSFCSR